MQLQDDTMGLCIGCRCIGCMHEAGVNEKESHTSNIILQQPAARQAWGRGQSCTRSMPLTSAPCSTRNFTVLKWPLCAHLIRGVSFICGSSQSAQARCNLTGEVTLAVRLCRQVLVWATGHMSLRCL